MLQNRFKKILVPLDGSANSTRGLNEAISLARQSGGTIIGIYVIPSFSPRVSRMLKSYEVQIMKTAKKIMSHARTDAARNGIEFMEKTVVSEDIVKAIIGYAKSSKSDIIVMGSRGVGSPHKDYLGSISNGVLHDSKIPVLVVK